MTPSRKGIGRNLDVRSFHGRDSDMCDFGRNLDACDVLGRDSDMFEAHWGLGHFFGRA